MRSYVAPSELDQDVYGKREAFARSAQGFSIPEPKSKVVVIKKRRPKVFIPRGGARGNGERKLW